MNPQKRQRRAMVRREVGPDEPKRPTRRRRKGVEPPVEPKEPQPRKRRTYKGPATPAWKAAGVPRSTNEGEKTDATE